MKLKWEVCLKSKVSLGYRVRLPQKLKSKASEMAQLGKVLPPSLTSHHLSLILRTCRAGEGTDSPKLSSDLHTCTFPNKKLKT